MGEHDDGGSAFPKADAEWTDIQDHNQRKLLIYGSGMTLRDYFAAKVMQSMVATDPYAQHTPAEWGGIQTGERIAKYSYQMADAMLKERTK